MLVSDIKIGRRRLDFSSSGQGRFEATEVFAGDTKIVNAIELLDFSDGLVQVLVCEACGITGCEPGSWVAIRRAEDKVIFVPAIEAMQEGDWEMNEYSPPRYIRKNGPLVFSFDAYEELRSRTGRFPAATNVKEITSKEALGVLQLTAPGNVLGQLGTQVDLNSENIVAVTEGDLEAEVAEFRNLISIINDGSEGQQAGSPERVIEFHLDIPSFPAWRPFGYDFNNVATLSLVDALDQADCQSR
ncbi:MAG: hypothetical protein AAFX56_11090 [Pseudomonadota bacterium]